VPPSEELGALDEIDGALALDAPDVALRDVSKGERIGGHFEALDVAVDVVAEESDAEVGALGSPAQVAVGRKGSLAAQVVGVDVEREAPLFRRDHGTCDHRVPLAVIGGGALRIVGIGFPDVPSK
jgi:hypothetical protein